MNILDTDKSFFITLSTANTLPSPYGGYYPGTGLAHTQYKSTAPETRYPLLANQQWNHFFKKMTQAKLLFPMPPILLSLPTKINTLNCIKSK